MRAANAPFGRNIILNDDIGGTRGGAETASRLWPRVREMKITKRSVIPPLSHSQLLPPFPLLSFPTTPFTLNLHHLCYSPTPNSKRVFLNELSPNLARSLCLSLSLSHPYPLEPDFNHFL